MGGATGNESLDDALEFFEENQHPFGMRLRARVPRVTKHGDIDPETTDYDMTEQAREYMSDFNAKHNPMHQYYGTDDD